MAKHSLPDPLTRRHLLERELGAAQALRLAEAYLEDGRPVEAVDLLRKAGAADRLDALRAEAVSAGDAFLLRAVCAAHGAPAEREEWLALAEAAARQGKQRYAEQARRYAERGEG